MDVDQTLAALRQAVLDHDFTRTADAWDLEMRLDQVLELFESLDGWLTKGGYLPKSWDVNSNH